MIVAERNGNPLLINARASNYWNRLEAITPGLNYLKTFCRRMSGRFQRDGKGEREVDLQIQGGKTKPASGSSGCPSLVGWLLEMENNQDAAGGRILQRNSVQSLQTRELQPKPSGRSLKLQEVNRQKTCFWHQRPMN